MIEIGQLTYPVPGRMPRRVIDLRPKARPRSTGSGGSTTPSSWRKVSVDSATMEVVIGTGIILHGLRTPIVVPQTTVTIAGGTESAPAYVYLEYSWGGAGASIHPTTTTTFPRPTSLVFMIPLHSFYVDNGSIVHVRQHQWSDILLPGNFA